MRIGLYDIHNHIMPYVDDGSPDLAMTERMLRIAYYEGIRHIILTPHYREESFTATYSQLEQQFQSVKDLVANILPDLMIYLGSELFYGGDILEGLQKGQLHTMVGSTYVLIEFPFGRDFHYIQQALNLLQTGGYRPILAHFERYECLFDRLDRIRELVESGIYMQINTTSVTGRQWKLGRDYIKKAIRSGYIHLIGTDAHNADIRPPLMQKCAEHLFKKYDENLAQKIVFENPNRIIRNEFI